MDKIKTIAILGSGAMGIDLSLLAALHGFNVLLWHRKDRKIASERLSNRLDKYLAKEILDSSENKIAIEKIDVADQLSDLSSADLVIESISENLEEKIALFKEVSASISDDCILVSNTSSFSIDELAQHIKAPQNFAGLHFFNPALKMELVELISASKTSAETISTLKNLISSLGKVFVDVKDSPGFIVNRLMACQIREAISLVEESVATPEDIDTAVKLGLAHPIGPLALADLIGNDVLLSIFEALYKQTKSSSFTPPQILKDMVAKNQLGRKTGQGFFLHETN